MDIWPGSSTHTVPPVKKGRPRKDDKARVASDGREAYPVVDHGSLTAANLCRIGKRLEWSTLFHNSECESISRISTADLLLILV